MKHWTIEEAVSKPAPKENPLEMGSGKCTVSGCGCPSYVEPPGGFDCARCGHVKSDHW